MRSGSRKTRPAAVRASLTRPRRDGTPGARCCDTLGGFRERVAALVQTLGSELPDLTVHDISHLGRPVVGRRDQIAGRNIRSIPPRHWCSAALSLARLEWTVPNTSPKLHLLAHVELRKYYADPIGKITVSHLSGPRIASPRCSPIEGKRRAAWRFPPPIGKVSGRARRQCSGSVLVRTERPTRLPCASR